MHKFVSRAPKRRRDYDDWGAADVVTEARKRKLNPGAATVEEIRRWDDAAAVELSTEYDSSAHVVHGAVAPLPLPLAPSPCRSQKQKKSFARITPKRPMGRAHPG
eukprot:TRINITY_DN2197_c0_g2_i1.p2 TRINITY_DN2197_c0_g2~~TRINITY_DN2197_c0_g2_i1.p2  ORF type:complete len:105 (-),score=10.43 TRINITY_DN2197_c0_g2_i1:53-367(-)